MTARTCPECGGRKTYYAAKCRSCTGDGRSAVAERYGRLTVLREGTPEGRFKQRTLEVRCECGTEKTVRFAHLCSGAVVSCGCFNQAKKTRHGQTSTPEHDAWVSMNQRCENPKNPRYEDYGGRGITVCAEWRDSFEAFFRDMGARPTSAHSIDRINNDGNYELANCRWGTIEQQVSTKRPRRGSKAMATW